MQFQVCAVTACGGDSRIHGATGIDDQHITCLQKTGNITELAVDHLIGEVMGDHEPNFIPSQSASFGRFTGF
jgi:hypothetical protein